MLHKEIELHDSKVEAITQENHDVVVTFSEVYIHQSTGRPGWDAGSGWTQQAELRFRNGLLVGHSPKLPEYILDGALRLGKDVLENTIPVPLAFVGSTELSLLLGSGESVTVRGQQVTLTLRGELKYVEEFPGIA